MDIFTKSYSLPRTLYKPPKKGYTHIIGGGTELPPLEGLSGVTAAWSMSRPLLSSFSSAKYTELAGEVMSIIDQTGNSRNFIQAGPSTRAAVTIGGPFGKTCAEFNGSTDYMESGVALSNFVTSTSKFMIISVIVTTISLNNANLYQNHGVLSDQIQFSGIYLKNPATLTVGAHNWDGDEDSVTQTITYNVPHVFTLRHEGGLLYIGTDGSESVGTATGATTNLTNQLRLFMNGGGTTWAGKFFEAATFNVVPSASTRSALISNFKEWVGAT